MVTLHLQVSQSTIKKFQNAGCLYKGKSSGRPPVSEEQVARVGETDTGSPKQSTTRACLELQIPQQTVWNILRKRLKMCPYKLQLVQSLSNGDKIVRHSFCMGMQMRSEEDDAFFDWLIVSDEPDFHIGGKVTKHNVRIWGTENPREMVEHVRGSPKVNVFCAVSGTKVCGLFFFRENTVTGRIYLDKKTVQTSFSFKLELRLTGIWSFEITWIKMCLDVGSAPQQTRT
jgi:hypothetical protein